MNLDKDELLTKTKEALEAEVERITYKTWLENLQIKSIDDNKIILIAESERHKYNIMRRFYPLLQNAFKYISGETYEIETIVESIMKEK